VTIRRKSKLRGRKRNARIVIAEAAAILANPAAVIDAQAAQPLIASSTDAPKKATVRLPKRAIERSQGSNIVTH
jgi:hypothetical protein